MLDFEKRWEADCVFNGKPYREPQLQLIAAEQDGFFTAKQAQECGFGADHHSYRCRIGQWLAIDKGLYRLPGFEATPQARLLRWLLWSRDRADNIQAVIGYDSALEYFGLLANDESRPVHLCVPKNFRKSAPAEVKIHHALPPEGEVETAGRLRLCTPFRALLDLLMAGEAAPGGNGQFAWPLLLAAAQERKVVDEQQAARLQALAVRLGRGGFARPGEEVEPVRGGAELAGENSREAGRPRPADQSDQWFIWRRSMPMTPEPGPVMNRRRRREAGFTLVELLVVIAIISILASCLLPALKNALASARSLQCRNNLRQLHLGAIAYADDYAGYLPPYWEATGSWDTLLNNTYLGGQRKPLVQCPDDPRRYSLPNYRTFSQARSSGVTPPGIAWHSGLPPVSLQQITKPDQAVYLIPNLVNNNYIGGGANTYINGPPTANGGNNHGNGSNFLFVNGQVRTLQAFAVQSEWWWKWN